MTYSNPFAQPEALYEWQIRASDISANLMDELAEHEAVYTVSQQILSESELLSLHASAPPDDAELQAHLAYVASVCGVDLSVCSVQHVIQQDWVAQTQADFPPNRIGRFMVLGSHHATLEPRGAITLRLDAGAAFGTGEHATTSGCLHAMDRLMKRHAIRMVLDMGCGTAILGMAAAKASKTKVLAVDNDAVAVRVAQANIADNGLSHRMMALCSEGFKDQRIQHSAPYDLIIANILARPVRAMASDIAGCTQSGAYVILSGFYLRDVTFVLSRYRAFGFVLDSVIDMRGWASVVLRRG